ncbi:MAG: hypothetical protein OXF05_00075 [Hyphomicrobiales bacterium]|nr:hypothetical protein [Hyphomicrobiales bacterium]
MDTETEEKLTGQQYQIDRLSDKVEAKMETMVAKNKAAHAESESAIDRLSNAEAIGELRSDYEKAIGELRSDYKKAIGEFRTDMEKSISSNTAKLMTFTGIAIAVLGVFVSIVSLIINLFV